MNQPRLARMLGVTDADPGTASPYRARARWFDPFGGFNLAMPAIPVRLFASERERAVAAGPTEVIALDLAPELGLPTPATTPAMLARYLRVRAGDRLNLAWTATTVVLQILSGEGTVDGAGPTPLHFAGGDVVVAPAHAGLAIASATGCLAVAITDEPLLALLGATTPARPRFAAAHYTAAEARQRLLEVYRHPRADELPAKGIFLGSADLGHVASPALTLVVNSLLPGESQPPHSHNAAAISVVIDADRCWSEVDGARVDWIPGAVFVTPPPLRHAHRNDGERTAFVMTVQDSGLHYHLRTMGFLAG